MITSQDIEKSLRAGVFHHVNAALRGSALQLHLKEVAIIFFELDQKNIQFS